MKWPDELDDGAIIDVVLLLLMPEVVAILRIAWYGGGAGVCDGFAVLGGGNGGKEAWLVRKNGFAYVARYRKSTFKPFCSNGCWPFDIVKERKREIKLDRGEQRDIYNMFVCMKRMKRMRKRE